MVLELHHVTIEPNIRSLSLMVSDAQLVCVAGAARAGKTTLLRAILGFVPIDGGHISIDGELLTPQSAPYFRRMTAYVPQHLSLPADAQVEGLSRWEQMTADERYLLLLHNALHSGKSLIIVDEPESPLPEASAAVVDRLLIDAARTTSVLAVNSRIQQNQIFL